MHSEYFRVYSRTGTKIYYYTYSKSLTDLLSIIIIIILIFSRVAAYLISFLSSTPILLGCLTRRTKKR